METMEALRKLSKAEYMSIRKKVRSNILINSEVAWSKRGIFYHLVENDIKNEFIIGGLVLEKHLSHRCSLYRENRGWENISLKQLIEDPSLTTALQSVGTDASLVLFDFSGTFTVRFSPPPMAFAFVKEGDIVYVIGKISPMIYGYSQGVCGSGLLTEEELDSYIRGESCYRENLYSKDYVTKIKEASPEEDLALLVDCGASSMEITNCLLKEISKVEGVDYFWVVSAVYDIYHRYPSERLYNLVKKYFYKWSETLNDMETEEKKEKYLQLLFPRKHGEVGQLC